jgi:hypothetical protein
MALVSIAARQVDLARQADGAKQQFKNSTPPLPPALQEYLKSIEILNRQTLPLRTNFNLKVQEYFKKND